MPIGTYLVKLDFGYFSLVPKSLPELVGSCVVRLLRQKREALGLSMNEIAKRSRLSHSMVSRVEHELRRPTLDTLLRISTAMDVKLWPLIKEAEEAAKHTDSDKKA